MQLKVECPYCANAENTIEVEVNKQTPVPIRCINPACDKWFVGQIKLTVKTFVLAVPPALP